MFSDLVKFNRSYRGFDESYTFTEADLKEYVELARNTASGANRQPLKYRIAWKKDDVEFILSMTKWAAALPQLKLPADGKHPTAFIVMLQDTAIAKAVGSCGADVGIAAQTILLGAAEKGLGGCMIANFNPAEVKSALKFADHLEPVLIIALGKPAEEIKLVEVGADGSTRYYRDENGTHYVPKRSLEDILV